MTVKTYPEPTPDAVLKDLRLSEKAALGVAVYPTPAGVTLPIAESDVTGLVADLAAKTTIDTVHKDLVPSLLTGARPPVTYPTPTVTDTSAIHTGDAAGGDLTGTFPNPTLGTSGVSAATYGSATAVAQVAFDAKGRATSASSVTIAIPESAVTNLVTDLAAKATPDSVHKDLVPSLLTGARPPTTFPTPTYLTSPIAESDVTSLVSDLGLKAPLASPALTGSPTAPTQAATDNSTKIATDQFVVGRSLIDGVLAPRGVSVAQYPPSAYTAGTLIDSHLFVGNGSNVATDVAVSGDIALGNTGATLVNGWAGKTLGAALTSATDSAIPRGTGTAWTADIAASGGNAWTPTLTQSAAVAKTINNATYIQIGKLVFGWCRLAPTANGTGNNAVTVSTPVTAATTALFVGHGIVTIAATQYRVAVLLTSTTAFTFRRADVTGTGNVGVDPNAALASSGDTINFFFMYEAA